MSDLITQMIEEEQLPAGVETMLRQQLARKGIQGSDLTEEAVLRELAEEYDTTFIDLTDFRPDPHLLSLFPARLLLEYHLLPIAQADGTVEVATSRLFDRRGLDALRLSSNRNIVPVLAASEAIDHRIKSSLGVGADTIDSLDHASFLQVIEEDSDGVDLDDSAQDASIIRFVNQILVDAIRQRTTDVHLEPFEDEFRIRYRIDGVLQDVPVPAQLKRYQPAVVSRIKILSDLDIAEKRLPQDGRIKLRLDGAEVDVRVSIIPMIHGEAVVLRLLRQDNALLELGRLGMSEEQDRQFRYLLDIPHGIVLVTGPTGSGKTTTLYAALQQINESTRKIVTIEDPVEYQLKGINQIQVSEKKGLTFARGLRSILRHDPDVILVGEIRDTDTARTAVQASLTGHLVFSTLHTNDSPGAVTRLVEMGVEPYLVASSVEGILAQRLVRVLCTECRRLLSPEEILRLPESVRRSCGDRIYTAVGCPACLQTGYHGRHAIFELVTMTDEIRDLVLSSHASSEIRRLAVKQGWKPLSDDGWRLVRLGVTTPAEIFRVTRDTSADGAVGAEHDTESSPDGEQA